MWRRVHEFDLIGDEVALKPSGNGVEQARLKVQNQFVLQPVDVQVGLHLGFGVDERGVAALPRAQPGHLVGHLPVDELHPIVSQDGEAASGGEVVQRNGFGEVTMLDLNIAVV